MNAREAARALGGEASGAHAVLCPGPNHGPRDRSLSVRFDPAAHGGFVVHSFAGDDPLACRDHVRHMLGLGDWRSRRDDLPAPRPRPKPATGDDDAERIGWALRLWSEARDPRGTIAQRYYAGRGLQIGDDLACDVLRLLDQCPVPRSLRDSPDTHRPGPATVALVRDLRTNAPCGLHVRHLTADAGKRFGKPVVFGRAKGGAVKLNEHGDVALGLTVGAGVESTMAARQLGFTPAWALISDSGIRDFPVLGGIQALTIAGEHDALNPKTGRGANQDACAGCVARWTAVGVDVEVLKPTWLGDDFNDVLLMEAGHAAR